jgi:hypothetical protein
VALRIVHEIDNPGMAVPQVAPTGGVTPGPPSGQRLADPADVPGQDRADRRAG